ncbi:two-component sensor histidine kinase [Streptomyces sp. S3(2020)]|uniref:sensor histidine kinase n=1 Tax=Streptomyces sp. S3(2020) TaxID=2732044 RepID=UPI0014889EB4|nr:histidine kinase [Streptomyces sp. S3(2020)]NNN32325.1 two-component sensor histidine kinase [Streptomyces sp. S3(2020)]
METVNRLLRQVCAAVRPEPRRTPLSRRALTADVVLAVLLTAIALVVAVRYPGDGPASFGKMQYSVPEPPRPPVPPGPVSPGPRFVPEETYSTSWSLVVLSALPLAARRRFPLAAFAVLMTAVLAIGDDASWINVLTCVIAAYSAVMHSRHRTVATAAMVFAAVLAGFAFRETEPILPGWSSPAVVLLIAGVTAGLVRYWRRRLSADRERLAQFQRDQEQATHRAVEEERARIAAELHDVVTHNVSVMVIQAGAARKVMDVAPERSKQALLAVEAGGRAAMAELRHVMGLLAAPDAEQPDGLEPQPGVGQLDALIVRVRAAGTPVGVAVSLPPDPLPPGIDLTAYRVVQEALTNTIKHAPGAEASVTIGYAEEVLQIEVIDTGAVRDAPRAEGNGRGLIGLRERLAIYGGELTAGPTPAGGYRVKALVPWRAA